jgi:hypothetical protein
LQYSGISVANSGVIICMVFDQIDKQLELVNISMSNTSQTTNQINSDCYKEMTKMSTARDNMPKWNNEAIVEYLFLTQV